MADMFSGFADRLLGCFCAQWAEDDPNRPARCCFKFDADLPTMGIALSEDECKCTTAWVRVVDWYVSSDATFPGPDTSLDAQNCPHLWALVLEMGVGRCPPVGSAEELPTCAEQNDFHAVMMQDGMKMRNAIYCCFLTIDPMDRVSIGNPQRSGPAGACMQQALQVTVMVTACDECAE